MTCYQLLLLGQHGSHSGELIALLEEQVSALGLAPDALAVLDEERAHEVDFKLPIVAIFFGGAEEVKRERHILAALLDDSVQIITVVSDVREVSREVPANLLHVNAFALEGATSFDRLVTLVLEAFRLLRSERRLFISYKRSDSQLVANQLYDALDARGFDVFIDVRSVPPGVDFQAELWHRLADSDVVVLLDTPGFRGSRWTTEELARANATNVQVLHVLWPEQPRDEAASFNDFMVLASDDFDGSPGVDARLLMDVVNDVAERVERLRARAISVRHRYLIDSFCDSVRDAGMEANLQPARWISVVDADGGETAVVPAVGVPTSQRLHRVFLDINAQQRNFRGVWVLYDDRGVLDTWLSHLSWLDSYLPVRTVSIAASDALIREAS